MLIPANLVNEEYDDRYFDVVSALDEAQQIYFGNNQLIDRIKTIIEHKTTFIIGETGFGAGRVVVALMEYLAKIGLDNCSIEYNTVELHPMTSERMRGILGSFEDRAGTWIDALVSAYSTIDITEMGWHTVTIQQPFGIITLNLWIGEALEMVSALDKECDVWFLDGHSPKKNPAIWRPELLLAIGEKTKAGGTCSTFTVAGAVKNGLRDAGFTIMKLPGCGGKNHVLKGVKES
jgi:tRNA U34 5-methylaminomethyl-2-thiouridine-forming methyltransferase MnmC